MTGRKIIVDTYGGYCPHGGGALSGKDPTKVDRSGTYMARYVCKNLVAAGICRRVELQVAYAIGRARPVSVYVDTFGTGVVDDSTVAPVYRETANYGHFGRAEFSWEKTDRVEELKAALAKYTL